MKIAYIVHQFPRLHNTFILNEVIGLIASGHDVQVFSANKSNEKVVNEGVRSVVSRASYFKDFMSGFAVINLLIKIARKLNKSLYTNRALGKLLFERSADGIDYDKYFSLMKWNIYAIPNIAARIKGEGFDVIHAGFGNRPATIAMILSDLTGVPYTFTTHAFDLYVDFPFAAEKISHASRLFTISHYNKTYLTEKYGCPPEKITVFRVPFNKEHCDAILAKNISKSPCRIISVCRLHPIKGLDDAIRAVARAREKFPEIEYFILGGGPLKQKLETLVTELDLTGNVRFFGDVSNETALELVAGSTLSVLPSVIAEDGDRDGIPTSLIESMYLETPVVSTRVSGIPELVDHEVNGLLADAGDVDALASAMVELLADAEKRAAFAKDGKDKVLREFDRDRNVKIVESGLRSVVG